MKKALVNPQNKIVQVADSDFPVHPSLVWHDCPDETTTRWSYDPEEGFTEPAPPPQNNLAAVEKRRWEIETGGIDFGGITIPTRDRDKTLILGKIVSLDRQSAPDTDEFTFVLNGNTITMTAGQIRDVGVAIEQHVQRTVDAQDDILEVIDTYPTEADAVAAYDAAFDALA